MKTSRKSRNVTDLSVRLSFLPVNDSARERTYSIVRLNDTFLWEDSVRDTGPRSRFSDVDVSEPRPSLLDLVEEVDELGVRVLVEHSLESITQERKSGKMRELG